MFQYGKGLQQLLRVYPVNESFFYVHLFLHDRKERSSVLFNIWVVLMFFVVLVIQKNCPAVSLLPTECIWQQRDSKSQGHE